MDKRFINPERVPPPMERLCPVQLIMTMSHTATHISINITTIKRIQHTSTLTRANRKSSS
ncbi:MAG: hypothetical protein QHJ82_05765 [Verrucomicrobiota bacterium]|nr:hypothetical protein [Verrucomicrobiota bacterium]